MSSANTAGITTDVRPTNRCPKLTSRAETFLAKSVLSYSTCPKMGVLWQVDGSKVIRKCYWGLTPWLWLVGPTSRTHCKVEKCLLPFPRSSLTSFGYWLRWGSFSVSLQMAFFTYLDRSNLAFAAFQFKADLHFSNSTYGLGKPHNRLPCACFWGL